MTWERPDSRQFGVTTQFLADSFFKAGAQLHVKVAPAGLAFAEALKQQPQLRLNMKDGHPRMTGTYLAACVLYRTITGKSPVGIRYAPPEIGPDDRDFLQKIASSELSGQ
jgi:hypothetical protein